MQDIIFNVGNTIDRFRRYLKEIFTSKEFINQKSWAQLLQISEPGLSQWLKETDYTFPSSSKLLRFIRIMTSRKKVDQDIKDNFENLFSCLDLKLNDIEKRKLKNQDTLGSYILLDLRKKVGNSISNLPFKVQYEMLLSFQRIIIEAGRKSYDSEEKDKFVVKLKYLDLHLKDDANSKIKKERIEHKFSDSDIESLDIKNIPFQSLHLASELSNQLKQTNADNLIFRSSKYFFPLHSHMFRLEENKEELQFYRQCLIFLKEDSNNIDSKLKLVDYFHDSFIKDKIRDLYPGLLFTLVQSLFVKNIEESKLSFSSLSSLRSKLIQIYIKGYETNLFSPKEIPARFYKRVTEIASCDKRFDFADKFCSEIRIEPQKESPETIRALYGKCNLYSHMFDIKNLKSKYKVFKKLNYHSDDIDLLFFKLRSAIVLDIKEDEIQSILSGILSRSENELFLGNEEKSTEYINRLRIYKLILNNLSKGEKSIHLKNTKNEEMDDLLWINNVKGHLGIELIHDQI